MNPAELSKYLFAWNDWVVLPAVLVAAIYYGARYRQPSLAVLVLGLVLDIASNLAVLFYPNPQHLIHGAALVTGTIGLLLGLSGFAWYWLVDRRG